MALVDGKWVNMRVPQARFLRQVAPAPPRPPTKACGLWTPFRLHGSRKPMVLHPTRLGLTTFCPSSVRLARGCSASFVSPLGLVQTNHHCARDCIAQLSTRTDDLVEAGFYAKTARDERKCPDVEVNQLTAISDVTARVNAATAGRDGKALIDAKRAVEATIARECSGADSNIHGEVVELYHGGSVDHGRNGHDDHANAVCGVLSSGSRISGR
jgi:Peptidase S46